MENLEGQERLAGSLLDPRTDRLGLLLDQFDRAREIAQARLEGMVSPASLPDGTPLVARQGSGRLTDEEYLWEPAPGAWSIRRRGHASSPEPFGPGEWVLDDASRDPGPHAGHHDRLAAGAPASRLRGHLGVDVRGAAGA